MTKQDDFIRRINLDLKQRYNIFKTMSKLNKFTNFCVNSVVCYQIEKSIE